MMKSVAGESLYGITLSRCHHHSTYAKWTPEDESNVPAVVTFSEARAALNTSKTCVHQNDYFSNSLKAISDKFIKFYSLEKGQLVGAALPWQMLFRKVNPTN